jgi:hypothetical protein
MVDIVKEVVEHAAKRGYTFSSASLHALPRDFPKLDGLVAVSKDQRVILYDLVLDQVAAQLGPPPLELHEDSIPNAGKELSKKFKTGGLQQFSASTRQVIKDCCPYC